MRKYRRVSVTLITCNLFTSKPDLCHIIIITGWTRVPVDLSTGASSSLYKREYNYNIMRASTGINVLKYDYGFVTSRSVC